MQDVPQTIARWVGPRGEVVLRRRTVDDEPVEELIVNGAFAMDSAETGSELALADLARAARTVLVGGLGLGFTAEALLATSVGTVDVVEIEEALVGWARDGLTDRLGRVAADPRVRLWVGDVRAVLTGSGADQTGSRGGPSGPWDAVLLDVDNGPDFLIHAGNADLYADDTLAAAYGRLSPGGILAIWCQGEDTALWTALQRLSATAAAHRHLAQRGRHTIEYVIYTVRADL